MLPAVERRLKVVALTVAPVNISSSNSFACVSERIGEVIVPSPFNTPPELKSTLAAVMVPPLLRSPAVLTAYAVPAVLVPVIVMAVGCESVINTPPVPATAVKVAVSTRNRLANDVPILPVAFSTAVPAVTTPPVVRSPVFDMFSVPVTVPAFKDAIVERLLLTFKNALPAASTVRVDASVRNLVVPSTPILPDELRVRLAVLKAPRISPPPVDVSMPDVDAVTLPVRLIAALVAAATPVKFRILTVKLEPLVIAPPAVTVNC